MLIHDFLERSAALCPDKAALIHEQTHVTYERLNDDANRLASFMLASGMKQGDRVVILLENSVEYIIAYYATLKSGGVAVPLSTDLKPAGLNPLIAELEPIAICSSFRFERLLKASDLSGPFLKNLIVHKPKQNWSGNSIPVVPFSEAIGHRPETSNITIQPSDLASIVYTSGSTGEPKGVMLTHTNIVSNTIAICKYLKITDEDIQMVVLPFFYVMGKSLLNTLIAAGGTLILNNKFAFPATVVNQMIDEKVTLFSGVPSTYAYLLHRSPMQKMKDRLEHLRMVTQAGGHMANAIKEALRKALPAHTGICIMYGATEASARLTWLEPERFSNRMGSIGRAIPGVSVTIRDASGKELPDGEIGELVANGQNIMKGYWHDTEATARVLDENGYHTGDLAYKEPGGFLYIRGRKDSLLKVGGHRINPQEIEEVLLASGRLVEAAVVGVPDNLLGTRMVGLVAPLSDNDTQEDILEYCSRQLPKYKLPSSLQLVRSLPKTINGKIDLNRCFKLANKNA